MPICLWGFYPLGFCSSQCSEGMYLYDMILKNPKKYYKSLLSNHNRSCTSHLVFCVLIVDVERPSKNKKKKSKDEINIYIHNSFKTVNREDLMLIPEEQKFQPLPFIKDEVPGMEIKE